MTRWDLRLGLGLGSSGPPAPQGPAFVNGTSLVATFSRGLKTTSLPSGSAFTVTADGSARTVTGVAASGSSVTLTLGSTVGYGATVLLSYTDPTAADDTTALQGASDDVDVASFGPSSVTNNTPDVPDYMTARNALPNKTIIWDVSASSAANDTSLFDVNLTNAGSLSGADLTTSVGSVLYKTAAQNGLRVLQLVGATSQAASLYAGPKMADAIGGQADATWTLVWAGKVTSAGGGDLVQDAGGGYLTMFGIDSKSGAKSSAITTASNYRAGKSFGAQPAVDQPFVIAIRRDTSGGYRVNLNGRVLDHPDSLFDGPFTSLGFYPPSAFGAVGAGAQMFETIICSTAATSQQMDDMVAAIRAKWGISSPAPPVLHRLDQVFRSGLGVISADGLSFTGNANNSGTYLSTVGTIGKTSGKWYFECTRTNAGDLDFIGIRSINERVETYVGDGTGVSGGGVNVAYRPRNGALLLNSASVTQTGTVNTAAGLIVGVAVDLDANTIEFFANGALAFTGGPKSLGARTRYAYPAVAVLNTDAPANLKVNFGDAAFAYTPPAGYLAWSTQD